MRIKRGLKTPHTNRDIREIIAHDINQVSRMRIADFQIGRNTVEYHDGISKQFERIYPVARQFTRPPAN